MDVQVVRLTAGPDRGRVGIVSIVGHPAGIVSVGYGLDWYAPGEYAPAGDLTPADQDDLDELAEYGAD